MTSTDVIPELDNAVHNHRFWCLPPVRDESSEAGTGNFPMYLVTQGRSVGVWHNCHGLARFITDKIMAREIRDKTAEEFDKEDHIISIKYRSPALASSECVWERDKSSFSDHIRNGSCYSSRTGDYPYGGQIRKSGQDFAGAPPAKVKVRTRLGLCFESLGLGVRTGQRGILPKPIAATRLKSSMSDYLSIVDDADLQKDNPRWKPSEWIGRQHTFNDIPIEFKSSLPHDTLAPSDFFASSTLPPWDPDIDTADVNFLVGFDATHPSNPSSPCDIPLLPLAIIRQLRNTHGQAWLDGKKSIRDARTPDHVRFYPLWALSYMELTRSAARSKYIWGRAITWTMQEREDVDSLPYPRQGHLQVQCRRGFICNGPKIQGVTKGEERIGFCGYHTEYGTAAWPTNANIADIEEEDDVDM
ncbi:hypothetical protein B0H14DRAFT_2573778 [Mycena olivaceomarginata]|nr:hypothetical protein B0H14DRAFT_2573778 [Mycena olivaceomarginata]